MPTTMRMALPAPMRIAAALIALIATSAAKADINWTGSPTLDQAPQSDGDGTLAVTGVPGTKGPTITPTASGFIYTDFVITYTSTLFDIGKSVTIDWLISRPFDNPAGQFTNTTDISGTVSLLVPKNDDLTTFITVATYHENEKAAKAIASAGPFELGPNPPPPKPPLFTTNFAKTASVTFDHAGGPDKLIQHGAIIINPSAAGQKVTYIFPGSVISSTVPEPSGLILVGLGVVGGLGLATHRGGRVKRPEVSGASSPSSSRPPG